MTPTQPLQPPTSPLPTAADRGEWGDFFATAQACADLASQMCLSYRAETVPAARKGDKTWVTAADLDIEKALRALILDAHPRHAILGEEEGGAIAADPDAYTWILDPVDGTFSFVHGIPFYSSLVALLKGTTPILGFACLPALGIQMSALRGHGAWIDKKPFERSALVGREAVEVVATADPYRFRMEGKEAVFNRLYGEPFRARTYPDALGYYLLLKGHVRAFVDPKVEVWDVAPFHVILPEAGFTLHPWDAERPVLRRGTSVAYALDADGAPLNCADVLSALRESND